MIGHGADVNMRTDWYGSLNQTIWDTFEGGGEYYDKDDIPTGKLFRGWTAYS